MMPWVGLRISWLVRASRSTRACCNACSAWCCSRRWRFLAQTPASTPANSNAPAASDDAEPAGAVDGSEDADSSDSAATAADGESDEAAAASGDSADAADTDIAEEPAS